MCRVHLNSFLPDWSEITEMTVAGLWRGGRFSSRFCSLFPAPVSDAALMERSPTKAPSIENIVVDEANDRTYVILAPRLLSDGEIYRAIRQELLRRGGKPIAQGQTLTLTLTATGALASVAPVVEPLTEPVEPGLRHAETSAALPAHISAGP